MLNKSDFGPTQTFHSCQKIQNTTGTTLVKNSEDNWNNTGTIELCVTYLSMGVVDIRTNEHGGKFISVMFIGDVTFTHRPRCVYYCIAASTGHFLVSQHPSINGPLLGQHPSINGSLLGQHPSVNGSLLGQHRSVNAPLLRLTGILVKSMTKLS